MFVVYICYSDVQEDFELTHYLKLSKQTKDMMTFFAVGPLTYMELNKHMDTVITKKDCTHSLKSAFIYTITDNKIKWRDCS